MSKKMQMPPRVHPDTKSGVKFDGKIAVGAAAFGPSATSETALGDKGPPRAIG